MSQNGWIKLYRCLFEKAIWTTSNPSQKVVLITLLGMVNHKESQWEWEGKKFICKPGQVVTSLKTISQKAKVSVQSVRSALLKLEKYGFLTNESTKQGRIITIVNWELYQSQDLEPTKQSTNDQQTSNKEPTTNKNDKKERNIIYSDSEIEIFFRECWQLYPNKKGQVSPSKKKELYKLGDELKRCISRYLTYVKSERDRGFNLSYKNGSTFFNNGYKDFLDEVSPGAQPKPDRPLAGKFKYLEQESVRREEPDNTEFDW